MKKLNYKNQSQTTNFIFILRGSLDACLDLVFSNFKPFNFGSRTFSQIQKPLNPIFKMGLIPYTHYTFSNARDYTSTKLYNQLKHGSM